MAKFKEIYNAFFQKTPRLPKKPLNTNDLEYMNSLSAAVIYNRPKKLHWVLIAFLITITLFIIWASIAKIDEIARGSGKVVPNGQNQIIQNLEGGIVSEILVKEGESVEKDQILIKISNEKSNSTVASNELKALYLQAQIKRLESELKREVFTFENSDNEQLNDFLNNENELYLTNKKQLESKVSILKEQIKQKENESKDARQTIEHLRFSVNAISKEVEMTKPMVDRGIRSQVDFLKLQREQSDAKQKLQSVILSVTKIESEILEINKKIDETNQINDSEVRQKLKEKCSGKNNAMYGMCGELSPRYGIAREDMLGAGNPAKSEEARRKISEFAKTRSGELAATFKGWIHTPSGKYPSKKSAASAHNISRHILNQYLSDTMNSSWFFEPKAKI